MYPDAAFTLVKLPGNKADALDAVVAEEFHLGAFELAARSADDEP
jgi:hypothetical protein